MCEYVIYSTHIYIYIYILQIYIAFHNSDIMTDVLTSYEHPAPTLVCGRSVVCFCLFPWGRTDCEFCRKRQYLTAYQHELLSDMTHHQINTINNRIIGTSRFNASLHSKLSIQSGVRITSNYFAPPFATLHALVRCIWPRADVQHTKRPKYKRSS